MEAVRCEGLSKSYGTVVALEDLDLVLEEGAIFGFLGPNGAGKTTTVKLLTGLSFPSAGRAWVVGEEVSQNSVSLRSKIGYLPEEPAFYNWMKGREFLHFVGELHGIPSKEIRTRCDELLELVDLKEAARRKIGGYSRGMRQRLGLAQALMNRPKVLFLDEPCSALDPLGRKEVLELLLRLRTETTIFMSTHILSDVERICDVVGVVNRGKLVTESPIEALRERYAGSVFEMEFEESPEAFLATLQEMSWVSVAEGVEVSGVPVVRLRAGDVSQAKRTLPGLVASSGLTLLRYEVMMPSLEDIFLEIVGEEVKN